MALSGTTTYTDMYYFEDTVAEATKEAGLRGVLGETVIGFPAPDYKTPQDALAGTEKFFRAFANDPLIVPAVAPHAIYTISDETLKSCRALANRYQRAAGDSPFRDEDTKMTRRWRSAARRPTAALDSLGVFNGRTVAAHGVWLDDADLAILKAATPAWRTVLRAT